MRHWALGILLISLANASFCQNTQAANALSPDGATKYLQLLTGKFNKLQASIEKQGTKALQNLQKQEAKLYKQLAKKDSAAAKKLFAGQQAKYEAMQAQLQDTASHKQLKEYLPHFDTLKTSLAFLEKSMGNNPQLQTAKQQLRQFESKMQLGNEIKRQIKDRKAKLLNEFKQHGIGNKLKGMHKEVYYYSQRVNEYKDLLQNHAKLEKKVLSYLSENVDFKNFFLKNSSLANIFRIPSMSGSSSAGIGTQGLQTRAMIQSSLSGIVGTSGQASSPQQFLQANLQQVNTQIESIKNKIAQLKNGQSTENDVDKFKPNNQKTKTFFERLEYGLNVQTQKQNSYFPVTSDIAGSLGFRLSDNKTIGIGTSYKMGWGSGIKDINITAQGFAIRSYMDIKIKKNWWLYGGYEKHLEQSQTLNLGNFWQESGLIGINKKTTIAKRTISTQVLFDFLYNNQIPKRQPIILRLGWTFSKK